MSREIFEARYSGDWDRLERILKAPATRRKDEKQAPTGTLFPARLTPYDESELPELYRRVCHQLALVRNRHYGADLEDRLNGLALEAHEVLYQSRALHPRDLARFFLVTFPRRVREERLLVLVATLLFVVPALGMLLACTASHDLVTTVVPPQVAAQIGEMYGPSGREARPGSTDLAMFGFYIYNNVGIAFRTFASGLFFGIGAIFFLVYNGFFMGAFAGEIGHLGYETSFYSFVIGHGSFELTAIALSGAAGLRLGFSILGPGNRTRATALREEGREALPIVGGSAVYLVIAAFLEAFWSSSSVFPPSAKFAVGTALWILVFLHLSLSGREGTRNAA